MYQSMTNYEQSNDFYQRQSCFMSNNSDVARLGSPLNHRFPDPQYRFNQSQMLTFYPNLNRNPNMYNHMPGLTSSRQFDEYPSGNSSYRLINMRESYRFSKLQPRPKNIVKITNPETGDNIFNELEKERKQNIPTETKIEHITKVESVDSPQSSPTTLSSTNLMTQQLSIPNLTSEESPSPKTFHIPPGSCESNSLMTSSSASSRPPSVSLASASQEMPAQNTSYYVPPAINDHKGRQYFSRGGPIMDAPYNERPGFHDQSKSMFCNHLPMMIPTFGCRPPYIPNPVQQMPGPRYSGYYNLPHNFYDQQNYYYEGEAIQTFFPHNNSHGYQMHSRFPGLVHQNVPINQSGSGSNSSEELNSECDIQFVSARLLDKSIRGGGSKHLRRPSESKEDVPNDSSNSVDTHDSLQDSFGRLTLVDNSGQDSKPEDQQGTAPVREITLDPNAKSFVYIGTLVDEGKKLVEASNEKNGRSGAETFVGSCNAGLEMKRYSSKGSNMNHMDGDSLGRTKKNIVSTDDEDGKSSLSTKMFRSGSEGGNLEKNPVTMPNGTSVSSERRNTDTNIGKSGRIQYSREFLLNLQYEPDSLKTPKGLTTFPEIILNGKGTDVQRKQFIGGEHHHHNIPPYMHPALAANQSGFSHAPSMSLPSVMHPNMIVPNRYPYHHPIMMMPPLSNQQQPHHQPQPPPTMGRQVKGKSFIQQPCPQQPSRKVIQVCLGQNVQLHQSENAWKPMTLLAGKKEEDEEGDEGTIMDLYRKVRSILNKLTPQKFDTLIQQVHDLSIDTEEKLKGCIKLIFEKAIGEPSFSLAYAQMAKSLNNLKVHVDERPGETVTFRKLLLNQCQKEFEKDKLEELDLEKMSKQIEQATSDRERQQLLERKHEAEKVAKRRSLGNIRFIGELFKLKMLTDHIMFDCMNRLMRYSVDEDNIECLCRLLVTVGRDLDGASPASKQRLNQSFQELNQLSVKSQLSSRIRFMVQDVMELRENDWIPRREDTKPKLIEQIHKEAELERLNSQLHKTHHQNSSSSLSYDLQRSTSLASSSLDHHRGSIDRNSFDGRSQFPGQQNHHHHHHYQSRGSIDRNTRQQADRFGSLERVKMSDSFSGTSSSGGGNGISKLNVYATLGHNNRRHPSRPLTGGGNSMSSSDLGRTLDSLRADSSNIQLAPSSYKQQHKPWQEGSTGGAVKQFADGNPLPPTALRSRGSASDIYGRSFARSPIRIAPRSRVFDPKTLERDKHAAVAAAKSISSSASADSFINPSATRASQSARDLQLHLDKPPHLSACGITLSSRELANQKIELEKKCQNLLEEYLTTDDLQEACLAFRELHSSVKGGESLMLVLTNYLVNNSLEKSDKDRHKMAVLLSHLVLKNLISVDTYLDSISSILRDAQDISIDIPKVWDYLAELVSRAILGKVFSFRNLSMLCIAIGNQEKQAEFIGRIIKTTTSSFVTELNAAVQPNFIADLILFLSNTSSNGNGDNRSLNEDQLAAHCADLKRCLVSQELEWQVLIFIKAEIMSCSNVERAPSLLSSILSMLQRCDIFSSNTIARWKSSSNGCK